MKKPIMYQRYVTLVCICAGGLVNKMFKAAEHRFEKMNFLQQQIICGFAGSIIGVGIVASIGQMLQLLRLLYRI